MSWTIWNYQHAIIFYLQKWRFHLVQPHNNVNLKLERVALTIKCYVLFKAPVRSLAQRSTRHVLTFFTLPVPGYNISTIVSLTYQPLISPHHSSTLFLDFRQSKIHYLHVFYNTLAKILTPTEISEDKTKNETGL